MVKVMTQAQQRAVALQAARYMLRRMKVDLLCATAEDAHRALDDYARQYGAMVGSQWYHAASDEQLTLFYRDWQRWQQQQKENR